MAARSYRRRGLTPATVAGGLLGPLHMAALATAIVWATVGLRSRDAPLLALLARAGVTDGARGGGVRSSTGYARRFALDTAGELLATHVGGAPFSSGHGAPARLVVPGRRGFEWVKWVVRFELSAAPAWLQAPLPLR